jgi:predicted O-methyltransferase YrrM
MAPTDPRILAIHKATWDFAQDWISEDPIRAYARTKAAEIGCVAVTAGAGATLRMLAAAAKAHNVVEIGTGAGVSALWLIEGMNPDGVLTSIDSEAEHQLIAKEALTQSGISHNRVRLINGRVDEVLERLTEKAYDLVFISGKPLDLQSHIEAAASLLRRGGMLVINNALWSEKVADPAQRDPETVAMRNAINAIKENENYVSALLPVGNGLLIAVKH